MPDDFFISTRTPGSRTSTYGLADHLADPDPHHQYLLRSEFTESGELTDGKLELHNTDPNAHDGYLAKVSDLTRYVQINNFATELANHLYHDYTDSEGSGKAASIKAVHDAHASLNTVISTHRTGYAQGSSTDHKDNTNQELYAHRVHTHSLTDLGAAAANHNHDNRYSLLSHNHNGVYAPISHSHNYLSESNLSAVGIYPHTVMGKFGEDGSGTIDPFDFNEEVTQGNVSIAQDVMSTAVNGPSVTAAGVSFLTIVTNIVAEDTEDDEGNPVYGERNCAQTLVTSDGVFYRIGSRVLDGSDTYTFSEWTPMGGGAKDIFEVFYSTTIDTPRGAFPLWTGETISNCKTAYPTFWARALEYQTSGKIRVVTSTVYDQELATYGECGAFVINTDNGSIRLPKITRFVSSLDAIGDIGVTKNDGIGNHAHPYAAGSVGGYLNSGSNPGFTVYRMDVDSDGGLVLDEGGGKQIYYTRKDGIVNGNVIHVNQFINSSLTPGGRAGNALSVSVGEYVWIPYSIDAGTGSEYKGTMWKRTQVTTGLLTDDYEQVELAESPSETAPKHIRLALYIQVFNTIVPTATTNLEARVSSLEKNSIASKRYTFTDTDWTESESGLFETTISTNNDVPLHVYMNETGGSVLVDESVEIHVTDTPSSIKLVAPKKFSGYITTIILAAASQPVTDILDIPNYNVPVASGTDKEYVATMDGWFNVYSASGFGSAAVNVNGVHVGSVTREFSEEPAVAHFLIPIRSGDRVTITGNLTLSWKFYAG